MTIETYFRQPGGILDDQPDATGGIEAGRLMKPPGANQAALTFRLNLPGTAEANDVRHADVELLKNKIRGHGSLPHLARPRLIEADSDLNAAERTRKGRARFALANVIDAVLVIVVEAVGAKICAHGTNLELGYSVALVSDGPRVVCRPQLRNI
jgi:hypothetical protein